MKYWQIDGKSGMHLANSIKAVTAIGALDKYAQSRDLGFQTWQNMCDYYHLPYDYKVIEPENSNFARILV